MSPAPAPAGQSRCRSRQRPVKFASATTRTGCNPGQIHVGNSGHTRRHKRAWESQHRCQRRSVHRERIRSQQVIQLHLEVVPRSKCHRHVFIRVLQRSRAAGLVIHFPGRRIDAKSRDQQRIVRVQVIIVRLDAKKRTKLRVRVAGRAFHSHVPIDVHISRRWQAARVRRGAPPNVRIRTDAST